MSEPARTFDGEVERIRLAAVARLADGHLGIHAEQGARVALVGIARPGFSTVIQIDAKEYDGLLLAKLAGFD